MLFGGLNGTTPSSGSWVFSNGSWVNHTGRGESPSARYGAAAAYDAQPGVNAIVLFGGCGEICPMNDTWLFSNGAWRELPASRTSPPSVYEASMASWGANGTILFGGCTEVDCSAQSNQTWAFQSGAACEEEGTSPCWVELATGRLEPRNSVPGLAGASLATDPFVGPPNGTVVLYGGFSRSCSSCATIDSHATWEFTGSKWIDATSTFARDSYPTGGRSFATLYWDPTSDLLWLYGGYNDSTGATYDELWQTDVYSWLPSSEASLPAARFGMAVASGGEWVAGTDLPPFLFGGNAPGQQPTNGTWVFERSLVTSATVLPAIAETNATVTFLSNTSGGTRPTVAWSFGDGNSSLGGNATHTYATAGNYLANLTATDLYGVRNVSSVAVEVSPFSLNVTAPPVVDAKTNVTFSATVSNGTAPFSFTWTFLGGPTLRGPTARHEFNESGATAIELAVQDGTGTLVGLRIAVQVNPPLAGQAAATPAVITLHGTTRLTSSATGGTPPYSFRWTLPGGRTEGSANISYQPGAVGNTTASVRVTDAVGTTWNLTLHLSVNPALAISPSASPTSLFYGRTFQFTARVTGGTGPYLYTWLFGDGGSSNAAEPSHTYGGPGTYTVRVWVNDSGGAGSHETLTVLVPRTANGLIWHFGSLPAWGQVVIIAGAAAAVVLLTVVAFRRTRTAR